MVADYKNEILIRFAADVLAEMIATLNRARILGPNPGSHLEFAVTDEGVVGEASLLVTVITHDNAR